MRHLFLVIAKLFGLFQIVWAVGHLASVTMVLATMGMGPESLFQHRVAQLANTLGLAVFCFVMAWVLLFRTQWLADKLRIQEEAEPKRLRGIMLLRVGIKLIGLFLVVSAIPDAVRASFDWIWSVASLGNLRNFVRVFWLESTSGIWTRVLPALLQLGLGLFLSLRTEMVLSWITAGNKVGEEEDSTGLDGGPAVRKSDS